MHWRDRYKHRPRTLEQTLAADRSKYIDAKINAAIGLCPEPRHPLDPRPTEQRRLSGANHGYKLGLISRKDYIR